MSINILFYRTI